MPMYNLFKGSVHSLKQRLLPCRLCESSPRLKHYLLCQNCWQNLPWLKQNIQRHEQSIMVACHYQYPIDRILQQFKYEQQLHYQPLLKQLVDQLQLPKVHAIVPMPISEARLIERGYNQSLLLAQQLSKKLKVPVWQPVQRQQQHSQKGLNRLERIEGIEQQFILPHRPKLRYRKVLIIDDVVTTGSSIHALAQVLRQIGCQHIYACCVAAAQQHVSSMLNVDDTTE
ncbi:ComF family protein [Acinetobacter ihumii]|uniref:ComF family protein n=1 Tax=Acinetobacter ihumii TaxID=2483802 RepID=UPI001030B6EE|nr:phosphoribosyltransferase family protein [Acinetobacter ihumii]